MMYKKCAALIATVTVVLAVHAQANLLTNPSFESGVGSADITGWTRVNNSEFREEETAFGYTLGEGTFPDGDFALKVFSPDSDIFQSGIGVTAGDSYFVSGNFYHSTSEDVIDPVANSTRAFIHIQYFDAGNAVIEDFFTAPHSGASPADQWVAVNTTSIAPAGAVSAAFHIETDSDIGGGSVFADNFNFQAVPEPTTLALVGIALGGFFIRRKNRR